MEETDTGKDQRELPDQLEVRNFNLSEHKSLKKKLESTMKNAMMMNMTSGGLKMSFNAGLYEIFRTSADDFYSSHDNRFMSQKIQVKEKSGNIVETKYKLSNNRKAIYTINLYHTKSTSLINGKKVSQFTDEDLPRILRIAESKVISNNTTVEEINLFIQNLLMPKFSPSSNDNSTDEHTGTTVPICIKKALEDSSHTNSVVTYGTQHLNETNVSRSNSTSDITTPDESMNSDDEDHDSIVGAGDDFSPDDSITLLKETVQSNSKQSTVTGCYEKCLFKDKKSSKRSKDMSRCNLCMEWFHDQCMHISQSEPLGFWICLSCRTLTQDVRQLKESISSLNVTTSAILSQLKQFSSVVESQFDQIHDEICAVKNQMKVSDKTTCGKLDEIKEQSARLRSDVLKKSDMISSKTQTVIDKITTVSSVKNSQPLVNPNNNASEGAENQPSNRPVEANKTLITGSSIIKGVRTKGLATNVHVATHPGATVRSLHETLKYSDLSTYNTVILHVGGNDASNGNDLTSFRLDVESLLTDLVRSNKKVVVSGILPRKDTDTHAYDSVIQEVVSNFGLNYVNQRPSFLLLSGEQPRHLFMRDLIHLSESGTSILLKNIHGNHPILKESQRSNGMSVRSSCPNDPKFYADPTYSLNKQTSSTKNTSADRTHTPKQGQRQPSRGSRPFGIFKKRSRNYTFNHRDSHEQGLHRQSAEYRTARYDRYCQFCDAYSHDSSTCWYQNRSQNANNRFW